MSEFEFKRGKSFKVDDTFFKDNFDITGIEDNIYNQMAKTIARNVDIDLAKTPLVDILTGYTRYKEAEYELQQKENIIKEAIEYHDNCVNNLLDLNKIDENERLAYKVAYEIHDNYLNILKGETNE